MVRSINKRYRILDKEIKAPMVNFVIENNKETISVKETISLKESKEVKKNNKKTTTNNIEKK